MVSPSTQLSLSKNWKLTLPTGSAGSPAEITQPRLQTYTDTNFRVSSGRVIFTARCGGVTTSGSSYPRSELREMRSNGQDRAAWSNRSGTHVMLLDQAFLHLPNRKPHCVAGQVHGGDDDITACRLEGKKLWITRGDDTNYRLLDGSYALGTRFTIRFKATPAGIFYDYNDGDVTGTVPGSFSGAYFKAGCYTQSNTEKGDSASAYGQVAVWGIAMNGAPLVGDPPDPPPTVVRPNAPVKPVNPCGG